MASTATDKDLGELHKLLAKTLMRMIEGTYEDIVDEEGEVVGRRYLAPPANVLAVAAKFLKDNSITSSPEVDQTLASLRDRLKAKGRLPTERDMQDAMNEIGKGLLQ